VKLRFSSNFKDDLLVADTYYFSISSRLGAEFHERVKETVRTVVRFGGGDHIGPHGYRSRKAEPFPYIVYYEVNGLNLNVVALVHERRHPNFLKQTSIL
jgi:hypothetical protein